jgi:hypothetical protein
MKRLRLAPAFVAAAMSAAAAHAATVQTFDLVSTLATGQALDATFTLSESPLSGGMQTATVTSFAYTSAVPPDAVGTFVGATIFAFAPSSRFTTTADPYGFDYQFQFLNSQNIQSTLDLVGSSSASNLFAGTVYADYTGFKSPNNNLPSELQGTDDTSTLLSGDITLAPAATPEPSTLTLLGTGVAALAGYARRRRA